MPLSEVSQTVRFLATNGLAGPPPEERIFALPELHFVEISKDRRVYIGERRQNKIQVFTTAGEVAAGHFHVGRPRPRSAEGAAMSHP